MRRAKGQVEVGFTARIEQSDKLAIDALLPMNGGKRWLIETALEEFVNLAEGDPSIVSWVNDEVLKMREEGRPDAKLVDFLPRVKRDLYTRFNRLLPEKGATTWFIRTFVSRYIEDAERFEPIEERVRDVVRVLVTEKS